MTHNHQLYLPINTLKPIAQDVWIVDGPIIRFGMPWPKMPFPTRMTIMRIEGKLLVHSPTPLTESLQAEIAQIGTPTWIIGPNRIHYWWVPEWRGAYPHAEVFLAPRIREQAGERIAFETRTLERTSGYPWDGVIETLPIAGDFMTEVEFFHRPSRTLVLTDFIENFEADRLGNPLMGLMTKLGGVQAPDGQMPRDMRLTYRKHRDSVRQAVETMIGWAPERIVIAHGKWFETDAVAELRRAFRWVLE